MLIYSVKTTSRLEYILSTLLAEGLGIRTEITNDIEYFKTSPLPKINYSKQLQDGVLNIEPQGILFDYGVKEYSIEVIQNKQFFKFFFRNQGTIIPFDLFGAAFWILSRYEEYLPHKSDTFNRFHYKSSLAYQYDFLHVPLVNIWLSQLQSILAAQYTELVFKQRNYNYVSTVDIDNAYKYKFKGFVRALAGYASDFLKRDFTGIKNRTAIILNKNDDPFDCYSFLIQANKEHEIKSVYFFLLGDYGINDKNHSAANLDFQSLIKHLADYSKVGIHPSFGSTNNLHQLKVEISRLSNITHRQIQSSRQHFSILKFPQTYQFLMQAGISEDYSMGYTNINGFRASYCYPFKWYSLDDELSSSLLIHPFAVSENTVEYIMLKENKTFMQLSSPFVNEVKKYGGELVSIFHNNNFTEKMKINYLDFLKEAK